VFGPAVSVNGAPASGNASNLTGTVDRPITITGTVSKSVTSVNINQQSATLSPDGKSFTFNNFFLREGTSLLSANATDSTGRIGSANVTVYVDQTAPLLSIENPVNNAVTSSNKIDVRGMVNDAVEGGLGAAEPTVRVLNTANQESVAGVVSDRFYFSSDLQLEVGANDLTVTSTDQKGNARSKSVRVVRIAVGSKRITLLGGNRQAAPVKSLLPQALQISAIDAQGNPLVNLPVRFDIVRGNGSISLQAGVPVRPNGVDLARNLVVNTDASGLAKVWMTLGTESSPGGNSVRAWSPEIAEDTVFTATGTRGVPHWVLIDGNASSQFVQANTAPVDALQSAVYDKNYNRMIAAPVRYRILSGEATFTINSAQNGVVSPDGQSMTVSTDKDGRASVRPIAGSEAGIVKIISEAVLPDNAIAGQALFQLSVLERKSGPTKFRRVVMNHTGKPLAGVRLTISRTNLSATSDANGKFEFASQVPPGKVDLFVDGRTVTPIPNVEYPALHFETAIIQGQDNQLPHAIYLPPVNLSAASVVGGNADVTLTIPGYEGFELVVKANSVTFPDGSRTGNLVISPVHNDRLPMVPPGGAATFGTLGWTIQPTGTRFDPPAEVKIPNPGNMKAGQTAQIVQWDHDLATFIPMGYGTVNENASQIITDAGSGITKAGWGGCTATTCGGDPGFPNCGENNAPTIGDITLKLENYRPQTGEPVTFMGSKPANFKKPTLEAIFTTENCASVRVDWYDQASPLPLSLNPLAISELTPAKTFSLRPKVICNRFESCPGAPVEKFGPTRKAHLVDFDLQNSGAFQDYISKARVNGWETSGGLLRNRTGTQNRDSALGGVNAQDRACVRLDYKLTSQSAEAVTAFRKRLYARLREGGASQGPALGDSGPTCEGESSTEYEDNSIVVRVNSSSSAKIFYPELYFDANFNSFGAEEEMLFSNKAALFRFFSNSEQQAAIQPLLLAELKVGVIPSLFIRTFRLGKNRTTGIANESFPMSRQQFGLSDVTGIGFIEQPSFDAARTGKSSKIFHGSNSEQVRMMVNSTFFNIWKKDAIIKYLAVNGCVESNSNVNIKVGRKPEGASGIYTYMKLLSTPGENSNVDPLWNDLYVIIGNVSSGDLFLSFRCEQLSQFSYRLTNISLNAGSSLTDVWDFDYTGTPLALDEAQTAFVVGGAKIQAGHLGDEKIAGKIYLNVFNLPVMALPSFNLDAADED
jgi:hypothetical protein